jgi:hypothetical protein
MQALNVYGCAFYNSIILFRDVLSEEKKGSSEMFIYRNKPAEGSQHRRRSCEQSFTGKPENVYITTFLLLI